MKSLDDPATFSTAPNPGESMTVGEIDGLSCALICGPDLVPPKIGGNSN